MFMSTALQLYVSPNDYSTPFFTIFLVQSSYDQPQILFELLRALSHPPMLLPAVTGPYSSFEHRVSAASVQDNQIRQTAGWEV